MKALFNWITSLSVRFRYVTLSIAAIIAILGIVAVTQLQQELLPPISFPQSVILAQVSGMSSEEVLTVVTTRVEESLASVEDVVNLESTTTSAIGAVIIARNEFGINQAALQDEIRAALTEVWLPLRRIQAPEGTDAATFAETLLSDLTPDTLIYLAEANPNFLFQLSPDVWSNFSEETLTGILAYMATQDVASAGAQSALHQLVDQRIIPELEGLEVVADISVSGGQALPGENNGTSTATPVESEATPLLLELSSEVWAIITERLDGLDALDAAAVTTLSSATVDIPDEPPALPESWQMDRFVTAQDLLEMSTLTRSIAGVFNEFIRNGEIVGPLGQTDDLTPEIITQMLAIEPGMARHFAAEHLVAMSEAVFAALPDDFIAGLDGFTRDELAAAALAESITGSTVEPTPVDLPSAWRISPPTLISFSFDDLPLVTFSIFGGENITVDDGAEGTAVAENPGDEDATDEPTDNPGDDNPTVITDVPEGPALPPFFALIGLQFGIEMNTADDLINIELPADFADQLGGGSLSAADLLNFMLLLGNPDALPPGVEAPPIAFDAGVLIESMSAEAIAFLAEYDPAFLPNLSADIYESFSDAVLSLPEVAPPLPDVWDTLAEQPEFETTPLNNTADLIALGDGHAAAVLNVINNTVPETFAGYEVRLFDSLTPASVRYFALHESDFYSHLDAGVLLKFSPDVLAMLPEDITAALDEDVATELSAIASGDQPSAAAALAERYTTDIPEADPDAPPINSDWSLVANFYGIELDTADDFFRFPAAFPYSTPSGFMNSIFESPQGAAFAPTLFGGLTVEAVDYMLNREPTTFDDLRIEALQVLPEDVLAMLPEAVQERATSAEEPFVPTDTITRTNAFPSLAVTVYKTSGENTVAAFHTVEDLMEAIDEENETIDIVVAFEQASFIEESISGVAREGGLGAVFAIVVILAFLSSGVWAMQPRRVTAIVMIAVMVALLALVVLGGQDAAGGDLGLAFDQADVVVRFMLIAGAVAGVLLLVWPSNVPRPAWRSTLVTAMSIPLSILMAMAFMRWVPPAIHSALAPAAADSDLLTFVLRLFPESVTLNIMTLSGLTIAIGRVIDDAIVVLENIFKQLQEDGDRFEAIVTGTRDVSVAIFAATAVTVVVFLPLGLTGGLIGAFFLPFGLAVTYALLASFVVAITLVPALAFMLVNKEEVIEDEEGWLQRLYLPILRWAISNNRNRVIVLGVAAASFIFGMMLFAGRPFAFLPSFGEPQISVAVQMPSGTPILETNALVAEFEEFVLNSELAEDVTTIQTIVGGGGMSLESVLGAGGGVSENQSSLTIGIEASDMLDPLTQEIRAGAQDIFGEGNVAVSGGTIVEQGFGGYAIVVAGPQTDLEAFDTQIIEALNNVEGLTNVSSNLADAAAAGAGGNNGPVTYIRVDQESAVRYTGELETDNTIGVINESIEAIQSLPGLPDTLTVSQGFESEVQTEGFASMFVAMAIASAIVIVLLIFTFGSAVHWLDIMLSVVVAPVGAAIALTLTNRVLGISAMIGMLMLIGIVVTNAVVLIDRVMANRRERKMPVDDALIEAGGRRLRPILMTAVATIFALLPLAAGLSEGAIIASELGTVVIGGLFSSTLLTLLVVPVAYELLNPLHERVSNLLSGNNKADE